MNNKKYKMVKNQQEANGTLKTSKNPDHNKIEEDVIGN